MMNSQSGQALPLAIMALAIGSLLVAPFLGYAGTDLIGSRTYGEALAQQSACDAGIEHAIWSLTKGTLAEQLTQPGDDVTYQLDETVNDMTVIITVTANATGGGLAGTGGAAAYEIAAAAGDRTIRAFVNTDNGTAIIVSWQTE
jgi:hypothetical protein